MAYFLLENLNELIYKEELQIHYNDYDHQILANKEYRYILENNNIVKYFAKAENGSVQISVEILKRGCQEVCVSCEVS